MQILTDSDWIVPKVGSSWIEPWCRDAGRVIIDMILDSAMKPTKTTIAFGNLIKNIVTFLECSLMLSGYFQFLEIGQF